MSTYKAVFRCSAGCPGDHEIWQPLYHCPTCGGLLQVVHDIEALRHRSPVGLDAALRRPLQADRVAVRIGRLGQEGVGLSRVRDENVVSMDEGGTNIFWAERYGRQLGVEDLWVKSAATRTPGRSRTSA